MTDTFATTGELTARLSSLYTVPANSDQLLLKASELIDYATMGAAQDAFTLGTDTALLVLLSNATCDQVEYWLETGEEHDVLGLHGSLQGGRVQIQKMPGVLGQRTLRTLMRAGLYWAGVGTL